MKLALTTIRNADIQNLLSNLSGELVSTYDTFQRQSIGAVPENRASPSFHLFYLQRTRVRVKIVDRILVRGSAIKKSSSHSLGTSLHPRPPRHSRSSDVRNRER